MNVADGSGTAVRCRYVRTSVSRAEFSEAYDSCRWSAACSLVALRVRTIVEYARNSWSYPVTRRRTRRVRRSHRRRRVSNGSRQARSRVAKLAAGIDAASMARRGHILNNEALRFTQRMLNAGTPCAGQDGSADSSPRSKGGGGRRPTGDMSGEESAEPSCPITARAAKARHDTEPIASSAAFPQIGEEHQKAPGLAPRGWSTEQGVQADTAAIALAT